MSINKHEPLLIASEAEKWGFLLWIKRLNLFMG